MERKRSKQRRTCKSRRFKCNANVKIMKQSKETENNNENSTYVAVVTGQQKEVDDTNSETYKAWKENHQEICTINHKGSSESMEKAGAVEIFLRSIETRHLVYNTFVGDGDTGSFASVRNACYEKYCAMYTVTKEECVGHIQKRMGSGLREYKRKMQSIKLSDNKSVGGTGRLTDRDIDKMQNNFGEAIRSNVSDKDSMFNAIWAIFQHMI